MPRSPAEYFTRYLISQQDHSPEVIFNLLEDIGLHNTLFDPVNEESIIRLSRSMGEPPEPWEPTKSDECKEYLRRNGIYDLWFPNAGVQEAYRILNKPQLRSDVEQLILSPMRVEEIIQRMVRHRGITLTVEGINAFEHYFWNKGLLSMQEWVRYLDCRPAYYERATALTASPDMAHVLVPWISGMAGPPATLNTGTVSKRIRDVAFMKVLEIEKSPATLAHSKMMKNYMDVIKIAESELRQSDVALKDVLQAFDKFRLRRDDTEIPSIDQVAGPNYSKSGEGTDGPHALTDEIMEDDNG